MSVGLMAFLFVGSLNMIIGPMGGLFLIFRSLNFDFFTNFGGHQAGIFIP
jgi:hypothetical protein